jgi:hypothetical protein
MKLYLSLKNKPCRLNDSHTALVEQAQSCLDLVDAEQLDEALVVLQSMSNALAKHSAEVQPSAVVTQKLADTLSQALLGATALREDSRLKLRRLRSVQHAKDLYSASSLPQ